MSGNGAQNHGIFWLCQTLTSTTGCSPSFSNARSSLPTIQKASLHLSLSAIILQDSELHSESKPHHSEVLIEMEMVQRFGFLEVTFDFLYLNLIPASFL